MRIILTKTLRPGTQYIEGATFDWTRPVLSEMERQCRAKGITDWYRFSAEEDQRIRRIQAREDQRPDYLPAADEPQAPEPPAEVKALDETVAQRAQEEPDSMASALVANAETGSPGLMGEALRQSGEGDLTGQQPKSAAPVAPTTAPAPQPPARLVQRGPQKKA